jgi:hypothetical protein
MARIEHSDVQVAEPWKPRVFIREINSRLKDVIDVVTQNRITGGHNNVMLSVALDATYPVWLATDDYDIESVSAVCSLGTGSLTPKIGGVNVGGVPFSVTATPTKFSITSPKMITPLDLLEFAVTGLTGTLSVSFELRRLS